MLCPRVGASPSIHLQPLTAPRPGTQWVGTEGLAACLLHCTIHGLEGQAVLLSHFPGLVEEL